MTGSITVDIPLSEEERSALENLAHTTGKGPNEIITDAVKNFLEKASDIGAAKAFEEQLKNLGTVDVTLKIPQPLFDFLNAVVSFTKLDTTVGEILYSVIEENIIDLLQGQRLEEIFDGFNGKQIIKAYKLDEIDC